MYFLSRRFLSFCKVLALFWIISILSLTVNAQTTLLSPTGDGGFETGSTLSANGWTAVNATTNTWQVGTAATAFAGSRGAYISNNSGTSWAYTNSSSQTSHIYRDIAVSAGDTFLILSFKWKGSGEVGFDRLLVYTAPTSVTPVAGTPASSATAISGATLIFTQQSFQTAYNTAYVKLPGNLAGTTFRLIFTWQNDGSGGTSPGAAVDNIQLLSNPSVVSSYTVNSSEASSLSNFTSMRDAFTYFNALNNISAPTTVNINAGQTFSESLPALTANGTSTNTLVFQKSGVGANPKIVPTGTGTTDFGICISGGDYVTFDGIDVDGSAATSTTNAIEFGYLIRNASATNGAQYNTIKNCAVTLNKSFVSAAATACIYSSVSSTQGGVTPTAASGANSYNKFYNLTLSNAQNGIYTLGNSTYPDLGVEFGVSGSGCQTARNSISNMGGVFTNTAAYGVYAQNQSGVKIFNFDISNVRSNVNTNAGILLINYAGTNEIYNNKVSDISNSATTTGTSRSVGIEVQNSSGTPTVRVYNNFIFDIKSPYTSTASATIMAYGIYCNNTTTATVAEIDNNNVYLSVASGNPTYSSACFAMASTSAVQKVRGNIFVNAFPAQPTSAKHVCWNSTSATSIGAAGSVSNYNDLYVATDSSGYIGQGSTTYFKTLALWKAITPAPDANSINSDPVFTSSTDLHSSAAVLNVSGFSPQAWVSTDIDCDSRSGLTTIGADVNANACVTPTAQASSIVFSNLSSTSLTVGFTAASPAPSGYLVIRSTSATLSSDPVDATTYSVGNNVGGGTVVQVGSGSSINESGLSANTTYYYFVYAYNNTACAGGPKYLTSTPLTGNTTTCLATPGSLSATSTTSTGFTANWSAVSGASGYNLQVSIDNFATQISGSPFSAASNSYALDGLVSGNTYYYKVNATGGGCASTYSSAATTQLLCASPSAQASNLQFSSVTLSSFTGSFTAASPAAGGYLVIRSTSATLTAEPVDGQSYAPSASLGGGTVVQSGAGTSFNETGLSANTQYYYFVYAFNNAGCTGGPLYNIVSALTGNVTTCLTAPSLEMASNISTDGFTATWSAIAGATGYSLQVSTDNFSTFISGSPFTTIDTSISLTGLTSGLVYYFRVIATGGGCNSAASNSRSTQLGCVVPVSLAATASSAAQFLVTLNGSFTAASSAPTGYVVVRTNSNVQPSLSNGTTYSVGVNNTIATGAYVEYVNTSAGSWTSSSLTSATTYYYWVFSYNNANCTGGPVYSTSATTFSASTQSCSFASVISINGATAVTGTSYPTLTAAIADLAICGISQPTVLELTSGYVPGNETYPVVFPLISGVSATNTITVRPGSGQSFTLTASNATAILHMNGAQYLSIDGSNSGSSDKSLTIINSSIVAGASTILFNGDASNNTVKNCVIKGSSTGGAYGTTLTGATVLFSTGTNGNDGNQITNNDITSNGSSYATQLLASYGSSLAASNDNITVSGNNFYDFFGTSGMAAINIGANSSAWTISNNKIYQTISATTLASSSYLKGIVINTASGGGYAISNNTIGFNSSAGTGMLTNSGGRFTGIELTAVATSPVSSIQGNSISNINWTTTSGAATQGSAVFNGIEVTAGSADIGTTTANVIGASTGVGSATNGIFVTTSSTGSGIYPIYVTSAAACNISNNIIGAIATGGAAAMGYAFTGISVAGSGNMTLLNNSVGNGTSGSIALGIVGTSTAACTFRGIEVTATGATTIGSSANGNTIQNVSMNAAATNVFTGILNTGAGTTLNINYNTIKGINFGASGSTASTFKGISSTGAVSSAVYVNNNALGVTGTNLINYTGGGSGNLTGIEITSSTSATTHQIQQNDFTGINYAVGGSGSFTMILHSAGTAANNVSSISGNTFTNLTVNTTSNFTFINCSYIVAATGTQTVSNNSIVTAFNKSGSGGTVTLCTTSAFGSVLGATINHTNNNFSNITLAGSANMDGWVNTDGPATASNPNKNISNNTFNNWVLGSGISYAIKIGASGSGTSVSNNTISGITSTGALYCINTQTGFSGNINNNSITNITATSTLIGIDAQSASASYVTGSRNIFKNTITGLTTTSNIVAGIVYGTVAQTTTTSANGNIYGNKISNLLASGATSDAFIHTKGIEVNAGPTVNVYNNLIGDLRAPSASTTTANGDVVRGFNILSTTATSNINLYNNTVFLTATSTGTNFGASAVFHTSSATASTATLNMQNNILINNSVKNGSAQVAVFRRSDGTSVNYSSSSDKNLFYASGGVISYWGAVSQATLSGYKAISGLAPKDANSITETSFSASTYFLSTTNSDAGYLKPTNCSGANDKGNSIAATFTVDYADVTRGATWDLGAYEFTYNYGSTTQSACDSLIWNGTTYKSSGTYTYSYNDVNGCLSVDTLYLSIKSKTTSVDAPVSACDSYTWRGTSYTASGEYTFVTTNAAGCDSVITINLTIATSGVNNSTQSACDSYTWSVSGQTYTQSGSYTAIQGCITEILDLTITTGTSNSSTASACDSYTWSVNGTTYTQSGAYSSISGCHTEILNLTITASSSNSTIASACDSYTWSVNGTTYTQSGTYSSVSGCHTEILNLTITTSSSNSTSASACDSYTWSVNGTTYTQSGTYSSVSGCHTEILNLTITASSSNSTSASACDSYTWSENGTTYTQSGTYSSVSGCHTEILNLTITASSSNSSSASACDSYTWSVNGTTYTQSGTYSSVSGCHTEILNLTITASSSNSTSASACDSYTWSENGTTYTQSGTYSSVSGCHTEILNLTITASSSNSTSASACDSYTWSENGTTYTQSGTYSSVSGCHTKILNLTITTSSSNSTSASACDSYTWSVNGTTYTQSGTYSSVSGCHTEILNLTITASATNSVSVSACGSYLWSVTGSTYTQSGTYSSVSGCNTELLILTITPCNTIIHVKAFIQGLYIGAGQMASALSNSGVAGATSSQADTIVLEVRDGSTGAIIGSGQPVVLQTDGNAIASFPAISGSHYIAIRHRNAIETWSALPVLMSDSVHYDFSSAAIKAYGSNMANISGVYALYSGDLNQDGMVESADYLKMENDIIAILFGYQVSDLNGDGVVESADYLIMENNINQIIIAQKPF